MTPKRDDVPVACALADADLRERKATLLAQLNSAVIATEELSHGYAFQIPGDKQWIATAAEVIAAERACCPFLTFELIAKPSMGPVTLRVTGPSGAKEFLRIMLCEA